MSKMICEMVNRSVKKRNMITRRISRSSWLPRNFNLNSQKVQQPRWAVAAAATSSRCRYK